MSRLPWNTQSKNSTQAITFSRISKILAMERDNKGCTKRIGAVRFFSLLEGATWLVDGADGRAWWSIWPWWCVLWFCRFVAYLQYYYVVHISQRWPGVGLARSTKDATSDLGIAAEVCTDGSVRGIWYRTEVNLGTRYTVPSLVVYVPRTEV